MAIETERKTHLPAAREDGRPSATRGGDVRKRLLHFALPVAVLCLGGYRSAQLYATAPSEAPLPVRETTRAINVVEARISSVQPVLTVYGTTEAGRQLVLRPQVGGKVVATGDNFQDGGEVKRGEPILEIDPFDYRGAVTEALSRVEETKAVIREVEASMARERSALRRAQEQLAVSHKDLKRAMSVGRGNLSAKAVDNRRITVSQRFQAVEARENNIAVLEAKAAQKTAILKRLIWQHEQAEQRLADTRLTAPFDGYVIGADAEVGRILNTNDNVGTLIDRSRIDVRFTLSKAQYARMLTNGRDLIGQSTEIRWRLGTRDLVYNAKIQRFAATIAKAVGGLDVIARIVDASTPVPLRPGAFVEVRITEPRLTGVVRLPGSALYGADQIYVVDDGRLVPRTIKVLSQVGSDVLVRGDIADGERVLRSRLTEPKPGLSVKAL